MLSIGKIAGMATSPVPDSVEAFIRDLRRLWESGGKPTFAAMSRETNVSKTVLNDATNPKASRMPSETAVLALVGLFAPDDRAAWLKRRAELVDQPPPQPSDPVEPAEPRPRVSVGLRGLGVVLVSGLAVGGGLGWIIRDIRAADERTRVPSTLVATPPVVRDGADPQQAGCVPDATTVASSVSPNWELKVIYSTTCNAFWTKAVRHDSPAPTDRIELEIAPVGKPGRAQRATEANMSSAYTFLVVRDDPTDRFCASAVFFRGTERTAVGPVC